MSANMFANIRVIMCQKISKNAMCVLRMVLWLFVISLIASCSKAGWAQGSCPPSPNYTPDFSSNGTCLALNSDAILVLNGASTALQITTSTGNQVGSAWYLTPQTVTNGFTTTFQFQFTNPSSSPADGIAFLVQNSSTTAIGYAGGNGGALGYGDADANSNPNNGQGIPYSVAIEFDSFQDGWDPAPVNGIDSHVAIQSCGTGANTSHHNYLCNGSSGANSTIGQPVSTENNGINFADGNIHSVTINYTPACSTCSPATVANLQVIVDNVDIYPNGIPFDLTTIASGTGTAFVGFTGATGGSWETQDILDWTFTPTQQGMQINPNNPGSLNQTFVVSSAPGQSWNFNFNDTTSNQNGNLNIQPGTTPFINSSGLGEFDWASIVNGTSMADTSCWLTAATNACAVNTMTCTNNANSTQEGSNCPQSTIRNILFDQEIDVALNQTGIVNGILTIPNGYAPGMAEGPDVLVSGGQCSYPANGPMGAQLCPQSIMTQLEDNTPRGGGTGTTTNSTYVLFCCEPEWNTTPSIPLWSHTLSIPASFSSAPPPTPNPNTNNFQAAQGSSVVVGAEPHGTLLDTTFPLPGEQSLNNSIPCPALGIPPNTTWSTQNPQSFGVSGVITNYDNNGTASALVEGAYDAHYFSVDCDSFEELVFPPTLNLSPGTPGANVASFKTVPFNIDTTAPIVQSIVLNPPGGYYQPGTSVTATVSCTDPSSATVANFYSGVAACGTLGSPQAFGGQQTVSTTPIGLNTGATGTQTFTATAVDAAGNIATPVSINYQVVGSASLDMAMVGNLLVKTGTNMTYYIAVANAGPSTAEAVTITNPIPAGTTFVSSGYASESCALLAGIPICSISAPKNSCGSVAGTCNIGALSEWTNKNPTGVVVQITLNVNAKANTTITDTATITETNSNPNSKHDSQQWKTLVTK